MLFVRRHPVCDDVSGLLFMSEVEEYESDGLFDLAGEMWKVE